MRIALKLVLVLSSLAMSMACSSSQCHVPSCDSQGSPTAPGSALSSTVTANNGAASLLGKWSSRRVAAASTVQLSLCENIQLEITDQTATTATGTFSMMCPDSVYVKGSVTGQLGHAIIPMTWIGTASQPGFSDCAFSVAGTGEFMAVDLLHLTFSGDNCHGPVEGSDDLRLTL